MLLRMGQTNLTTMLDCIQPVLTKCNVSDSNLSVWKIQNELVKSIKEEFDSP